MEEKRLGARGPAAGGPDPVLPVFSGAGNLIFPSGIGAMAGVHTWPAVAGTGRQRRGPAGAGGGGGVPGPAAWTPWPAGCTPSLPGPLPWRSILPSAPAWPSPGRPPPPLRWRLPPFVGEGAPVALLRLAYSLVFFAAALALALRPEKLTDRLGKDPLPCAGGPHRGDLCPPACSTPWRDTARPAAST